MIRGHELILPTTGILLTLVGHADYGAVALLITLIIIAWGIRSELESHRSQVEWNRDE